MEVLTLLFNIRDRKADAWLNVICRCRIAGIALFASANVPKYGTTCD
jgi:hypothetical protein